MRSFCVVAAEALVLLTLLQAAPVRALDDPAAPEAADTVRAEPRPLDGRTVSPTPETLPEEPRRLPIPAAQRPLTLVSGVGTVHTGFTMRMGPLVMSVPLALGLGITDDLTVEARYTFPYEPELRATGRVFHDDVVELGLRGLLRIPAVRQGDTVAALEAVVLFHHDVIRVETGLGIDLLFSEPVSPLVYVPLAVQLSVARHIFIGVRGWAGNDDGYWSGSAGPELGFNVASTLRPVVDIRIAVQLAFPSDGVTWMITHTFYPTIFE